MTDTGNIVFGNAHQTRSGHALNGDLGQWVDVIRIHLPAELTAQFHGSPGGFCISEPLRVVGSFENALVADLEVIRGTTKIHGGDLFHLRDGVLSSNPVGPRVREDRIGPALT